MPQMPGGMDMNAIMSMMGDQGGAQNAQMADMLKQMQNMSAAGQNGDKTQQLQGMPANVQIPAGMDINSIMSMSPEQLKQMGVPEEQIKTITQARQQMGQIQNMSGANNSLQTQNMSGTYANGTPKTQINKLQTSGN